LRFNRLDNAALSELRSVVGERNVLTGRADLLCYSYDATKQESLPEAVVIITDSRQARELVLFCNRRLVPLYARGAGSNLSGGSFPSFGGIVADFSKMNRILSISPDDLVAVVEPGVITGDLQRKVAEFGLKYPPDPASADFSTIGGNIAECAGGLTGVKYGVTRDYVLSLEVVTGSGELVRLGRPTLKDVAGLDLTRLVVGSEGTLALVTQATLKLIPMPESEAVVRACYDSLEKLAAACGRIFARRIFPTTMEFMDRPSLDCVRDYRKTDIPLETDALLLVALDGSAAEMQSQAERVKEACLEGGAFDVRTALLPEDRERLWGARKAISPALYRIAPRKLNEDICVPRSKLPEMVRRIAARAGQFPTLKVINFGHIGDGNIHMNVQHEDTEEDYRLSHQFMASVMPDVVELGGTVSGEHGIGNRKVEFLPMELGPQVLELMRKVKKVFDPRGILNPGKLLPAGDTEIETANGGATRA